MTLPGPASGPTPPPSPAAGHRPPAPGQRPPADSQHDPVDDRHDSPDSRHGSAEGQHNSADRQHGSADSRRRAGAGGGRRGRGGGRRRWHRLAIPIGVALLLLAATGIAHEVDQPDRNDDGFLSPVNTDDHGGSLLAAELRARGVTVERMTSTRRALNMAPQDGFTLFVPAPALVHPLYLPLLVDPAQGARIVLVEPSQRVLDDAHVPLVAADRRWATRTVGPDTDDRPCPLAEARAAGPAAALLQRYADAPWRNFRADRCYQGGLARTSWRENDVVVIGASDPFRNDRLDERGNTALATGLLAPHGRVVWLDLAGPEPPPPYHPDGELGPWYTMPAEPPPGGDEDPAGPQTDSGYDDPSDGQTPQGKGPDPDPKDRPNPLWEAFPPWFWALLLQLALAALLAVLWRARRLGPPVAEPLPVTVPSAETVLGRGRLYQRARAYGPAADILRGAALHRLLPLLNLPPDAGSAEVAAAVAGRTGQSPGQVHDLLYGPAPESNPELLDLAQALDRLAVPPVPPDPSAALPSGAFPSGAFPSGPLPSGPLPSGPLPSGPLPSGPLPSGQARYDRPIEGENR